MEVLENTVPSVTVPENIADHVILQAYVMIVKVPVIIVLNLKVPENAPLVKEQTNVKNVMAPEWRRVIFVTDWVGV